MRRRTKDFDLPPRCDRLPSGSIRWRPLGDKPRVIADKHMPIADVWATYRELSSRSARNTLGWLADEWYETHNFKLLGERTRTDYQGQIAKHPLMAFEEFDISEIESSDIYEYMTHRGSIRRANMELVWLRHVLQHGVHLGLLQVNPAESVQRLKERTTRRKYVTDLTYWMVYAKASDATRVAMEISYCTGLRQGDVLGLRWEEIDGSVKVREGKTGREFKKAISPRLAKALEEARKLPGQPFGGWVVRNNKGNRYTAQGFKTNFRRALDKCPEHRQFRFHDIRRKAITDFKGNNKLEFSMHTNARMLGVYDLEVPTSPSH